MSLRQISFWVLAGLTAVVYGLMVAWSIPLVTDAAGGLKPLETRPLGYSADEARAFVAALSAEGRQIYLGAHGWLGIALALLYAPLAATALWLLTVSWHVAPRVLIAFVPVAAGLVDLAENAAITLLFTAESLPDDMLAASASFRTVSKTVLTVVYGSALMGLGGLAAARSMETR